MSSCIKKTKMRGQGSKPRISKKLNLDDVCGLQNDSFKNKRTFQNHFRTHGEELFTCTECPANWSEGPENMFNTKKQVHTCLNTTACTALSTPPEKNQLLQLIEMRMTLV